MNDVIYRNAIDFGNCKDCVLINKTPYVNLNEIANIIKSIPAVDIEKYEHGYKFYYCDSEDLYLLGKRIDNMYYAHWRNGSFIWDMSRYLPWGKTINGHERGCAWGIHTFPSEPREIGFEEWIIGFLKQRYAELNKI